MLHSKYKGVIVNLQDQIYFTIETYDSSSFWIESWNLVPH